MKAARGTQQLSWGRYPAHPQTLHANAWRCDLSRNLAQHVQDHQTTLPFGNGRSYGDSCLAASDHVLHMRPLDRLIAADWDHGLLTAEAGITLAEILQCAIPRGWFLPVTPGTQYVTLGGALANDVHGKNHHVRGTFGRHVRRFSLVRSDRPPLICTPKENTELFTATIGGLGLTGCIEWIELQLMPIRSSRINTLTRRFGALDEFFALSRELDTHHEYSVAWIDCLAKGACAGRGVWMAGDHATEGPLTIQKKRRWTVPFTPPVSAVNPLTLRLFNTLYYHRRSPAQQRHTVSYETFFYPLDAVLQWNRLYGPRGFQQYQCVISEPHAEAGIAEVLKAIANSGRGSFLAVLKRCGDIPSPGLLSFPMPGVTLALDFPQHESLNRALFERLDAIVRQAEGRLYPAKDAHMSGADFRRAYPNWPRIEALRDPALCSRFWKRVTQL